MAALSAARAAVQPRWSCQGRGGGGLVAKSGIGSEFTGVPRSGCFVVVDCQGELAAALPFTTRPPGAVASRAGSCWRWCGRAIGVNGVLVQMASAAVGGGEQLPRRVQSLDFRRRAVWCRDRPHRPHYTSMPNALTNLIISRRRHGARLIPHLDQQHIGHVVYRARGRLVAFVELQRMQSTVYLHQQDRAMRHHTYIQTTFRICTPTTALVLRSANQVAASLRKHLSSGHRSLPPSGPVRRQQ